MLGGYRRCFWWFVCYLCSVKIVLRRFVAPLVAACLAVTALSGAPASAAAATEVTTGWYPIDQPDVLHDYSVAADPLHVVATAGGSVQVIGPVLGRTYLHFPNVCPARTAPAACPRAVLEAAPSAAQNPGTRAMRFGVVVALPPGQTDTGENLMQKGYSTSGSQWKVQVDGAAGDPSCVLSGGVPNRIYRVKSPVSIADGGWHAVECQRAGGYLTIVQDGVWRGAVAVPTSLSIANDQPLRIGGQDVREGSDQFHGYLDAAWIAVDSPPAAPTPISPGR